MELITKEYNIYKLLNLETYTPFDLDGVSYSSAADYIYKNLLIDKHRAVHITNDVLKDDPYNTIINTDKLFFNSVKHLSMMEVLKVRFDQHKNLYSNILSKYKSIISDNLAVSTFYNSITPTLMMPRDTFIRLSHVLYNLIKDGKDIETDLTVHQLYEKYMKDGNATIKSDPFISQDEMIYSYAHNIVEYITEKIQFKDSYKQYVVSINHFWKTLQKNYYEKYNSYGTHDQILQWHRSGESGVGQQPTNPLAHVSYDNRPDFRLEETDDKTPLSPSYDTGIITIRNKSYKTCTHYMYSECFRMLNIPQNANAMNIVDLPAVLVAHIHIHYNKRIRTLTDIALKVRFEKYPTLLHLLKTVPHNKIIANILDPILGTGRDGKGGNYLGECLQLWRQNGTPVDKTYANITDNILIRTLLQVKMVDIFRSIQLFVSATFEQINELYGFPKVKMSHSEANCNLSTVDVKRLVDTLSIDAKAIAFIWGIIWPQFYTITHLNDQQLAHIYVTSANRLSTYSGIEVHKVKIFFENFYNNHKSNIQSSLQDFISVLLTGYNNDTYKDSDIINIFRRGIIGRIAYWDILSSGFKG